VYHSGQVSEKIACFFSIVSPIISCKSSAFLVGGIFSQSWCSTYQSKKNLFSTARFLSENFTTLLGNVILGKSKTYLKLQTGPYTEGKQTGKNSSNRLLDVKRYFSVHGGMRKFCSNNDCTVKCFSDSKFSTGYFFGLYSIQLCNNKKKTECRVQKGQLKNPEGRSLYFKKRDMIREGRPECWGLCIWDTFSVPFHEIITKY